MSEVRSLCEICETLHWGEQCPACRLDKVLASREQDRIELTRLRTMAEAADKYDPEDGDVWVEEAEKHGLFQLAEYLRSINDALAALGGKKGRERE